nr:hypothetical protein GCM10017745_42180 [Saccharothrix mutabilis subsp. capreolus]
MFAPSSGAWCSTRVDEPLDRDDPVGVEREHGQHDALPWPAEVVFAPIAGQGDGAEESQHVVPPGAQESLTREKNAPSVPAVARRYSQ